MQQRNRNATSSAKMKGKASPAGLLGPGTGKNVPVEVVVMAMRRVSFAALGVTRRALVFGRASSQNQKGSTHFHRASALRKVIDLKPL
jgi:hypothetical protein